MRKCQGTRSNEKDCALLHTATGKQQKVTNEMVLFTRLL